jgi:hypothetical protein
LSDVEGGSSLFQIIAGEYDVIILDFCGIVLGDLADEVFF